MRFINSKGILLDGKLDKVNYNKRIVVMCHGFSSSKKGRTMEHVAPALNEAGLNTFRFDFFGHGDSEGSFEDITISEGIDDALNAIEYVKKLGYTRIGLLGVSFGGIVAMGAVLMSKDIKKLCLMCPVSDFVELIEKKFVKDDIEEWRKKGFSDYQDKKLKYGFYEDAKKWVMYGKAEDIDAETLVIHGDKDETVPIEQSRKLVKHLIDGRLHVVKGANHRLMDEEKMGEAVSEIVEFFK